MFCKKSSTNKSAITPQSLPPTADAEGYHSLRSYHQVQNWETIKKNRSFKIGMESAERHDDCHSYSTETSTARVTEDISLQLHIDSFEFKVNFTTLLIFPYDRLKWVIYLVVVVEGYPSNTISDFVPYFKDSLYYVDKFLQMFHLFSMSSLQAVHLHPR